MGKVLRCWFVRHGKVDSRGKLYGSSDWSCLPILEKDVEFLRRVLPENARYVTSGLQRTHQTLEKISQRAFASSVQDRRLNEQSLGNLEGERFEDLKENEEWQALLRNFAKYCPSGGESFESMVVRVGAYMDELCTSFVAGGEETENEENYVLVVHAGVIRSAIVHGLGLCLHTAMQFDVSHLSLTVLEYRKDTYIGDCRWRLSGLNGLGA